MDHPTSATTQRAQPNESQNEPQRSAPRKRKNHRGGRKKKPRRKSFAFIDDVDRSELGENAGEGLYQIPSANLSGNSIDSEALLDHRLVHRSCHLCHSSLTNFIQQRSPADASSTILSYRWPIQPTSVSICCRQREPPPFDPCRYTARRRCSLAISLGRKGTSVGRTI